MFDGPEARRIEYLENELRQISVLLGDIHNGAKDIYNNRGDMPEDVLNVLTDVMELAKRGGNWCDMLTSAKREAEVRRKASAQPPFVSGGVLTGNPPPE